MQVFLIHGMGRTPASMVPLAWRLSRAGFRPSLFGYRVSRDSLATIADDFASHVDERRIGTDSPYAIVGHSLGNVIARMATHALPPCLARFAMLAPPNRSPILARLMQVNPAFRALTRDAGSKLASHAFIDSLPRPNVPTAIFAGLTNAPWLPFRGAPSDGIVAVEETCLDTVPHRVYDVSHTFIMNDPDVTAALIDFLEHGVVHEPC